MKFSREIYFNPAYDRRSKDPKRNYGIHGVTLVMFLKGDKGAVNFTLYTNWNLPHVTKELLNRPSDEYSIQSRFLPLPAEVMYHSPIPMYEGQTATTNTCEHIGGVPCYSDYSCLDADQFYQALLEEGSEGVWRKLEEYYYKNFGKEEEEVMPYTIGRDDIAFEKKIAEALEHEAHILQGEPFYPTEWRGDEKHMTDRMGKLVETVSRYSGIGWWYLQDAGKDGIAVVLIYKDGRRIFLTAKDFLITEKLDVGGKKPSQEVEE